jgi:hypothetical protein
MTSAAKLKHWNETQKASASIPKLLLGILVLVLASLLLSQPSVPRALVEDVVEPAAAAVEKAFAALVPGEAPLQPLAVDETFAAAASSIDYAASEPAVPAAAEDAPVEIPIGVSSWYGVQSPPAGKPVVISGGSAGMHHWK